MEENTERSYAILGMGRYGRKVADTMAKTGVEVLVADPDYELINECSGDFSYAVSVDMNNASALKQLGLDNIDVAIIDLSDHLEAAIMATMVAREEGVSRIIATSKNKRMGDILTKLGADEVVIPEEEAALRMAKRLISEDFLEYFDLGGNMCVIKAYPLENWVGKTLRELKLREKRGINIIAVERDGELKSAFTPDDVLESDKAVAMALTKDMIYEFV